MDIDTTLSWVRAIASAVQDNTDYLTQLDSAIGDADHGANMQRGFDAVVAMLDERAAGSESVPGTESAPGTDAGPGATGGFATVGEVLVKTGTTLVSTVGGASGPLYGTAFRAAGRSLTEPEVTGRQLSDALTAGLEAVRKLGAAAPGDKTMIDAYAPALNAFDSALRRGTGLAEAAAASADAAEEGMRATIPMIARKGRASYLGPRSEGHQDPGATSTALIFRALAEVTAQ